MSTNALAQRNRCGVVVVLAGLAIGFAPGAANAGDRSIDGTGNNIVNSGWGAAGINFTRVGPVSYTDGSTMVGDRPNPRAISNAVFSQSTSIQNARGLTDMVWQWGQFLDHDMDLTVGGGAAANITVPLDDPTFMPGGIIPFNRAGFAAGTGDSVANPRQQINAITAYIDASNVYGSDMARAAGLRTMSGGRMLTSASATGDMLPFNTGGLDNDNGPLPVDPTTLFVAGDVRANEQVGLTSMHTLMVREHNRLADAITAANPGMADEDVYQAARKIVGAQMQTVTYNEFLPAMLGDSAMPAYGGYDPSVNTSITNEFASALYRVGHTMLSSRIKRLDDAGNVIPEGNLSLRDAFFAPDVVQEAGIDPILKGLTEQVQQETDTNIVDDVRNFLFFPGSGIDLAALNIQRGRDTGLGTYNDLRAAFGLTQATSFDDITSDTAVAQQLRDAYGTDGGGNDNVDLVDPWVGALAEDNLLGSSVGELMNAGLVAQFVNVRDGDRYFYLNDAELSIALALAGLTMSDLEGRLLSDIIEDNTSLTNMRDNVFFIPTPGTVGLLALGALAGIRRRR